MQSSNVPCRPGFGDWLRGIISYQAPARATGGSATRGLITLRVTSPRGSLAATASARASLVRAVASPVRSKVATARSMTWRLCASGGVRSDRSSRPSLASSVVSCPASVLRAYSLRQVAKRSVHASTANRYKPGVGGVKWPCHRSLLCGSIGTRCQSPSASLRQMRAAASTSWPSRRMSHQMSMRSPAIRLTAWRPPSTLGKMSSIRNRGPVGSAGDTSSCGRRSLRSPR